MAWFDTSGDEAAYKRWLLEFPEGYVLNHPNGSKITGNIAHRANCRVMARAAQTTQPGKLTNTYIKFCSLNYDDLASALEQRKPGAKFRSCRMCSPP